MDKKHAGFVVYSARRFFLPAKYDDSVYLLEKAVLPRFAIVETNKLLVQKVDFVVSGGTTRMGWGVSSGCLCEKAGKNGDRALSL